MCRSAGNWRSMPRRPPWGTPRRPSGAPPAPPGASQNLLYGEGQALLSSLPSNALPQIAPGVANAGGASAAASPYGLAEDALTETALTGTGASYYLDDGRGSVAALVAGGEVAAAYAYSPWGEASGAGKLPFFGYNSQEHVGGGTALQYLRARFYDAAQAAFPTADTYLGDVSDPATLNRYTYCAGNPVTYSDPTGHERFSSQKQRNSWLKNNSAAAKRQKAKGASGAVSRATSRSGLAALSAAGLVPGVSAVVSAASKARGQTALRAASARVSLSAAASLLPGRAGKAVLGAVSQAGKRKSAATMASALSARSPGIVGYAQRQVAAVIERFCGSAPRMGSDSSGAAPQVHYTYDRKAAVEYARKYSSENQGLEIGEEFFWALLTGMGRNPMYPNYPFNCANFASQVAAAGGMPMTDKWHSLREYEMLWESPSGVRQADRYKWDVTFEWRVVENQFNYFSDPANGFTNGVVEIYGGSGPKRNGTAASVDKLTAGTTALGVKPATSCTSMTTTGMSRTPQW